MSKHIQSTKVTNVVPPWIQEMRDVVAKSISTEDVKAMIEAQVKKAKEGDERALKFVFEYVLGGMDLRGATFVQKNYSGKRGAKPATVSS